MLCIYTTWSEPREPHPSRSPISVRPQTDVKYLVWGASTQSLSLAQVHQLCFSPGSIRIQADTELPGVLLARTRVETLPSNLTGSEPKVFI